MTERGRQEETRRARSLLAEAGEVLVLTGAGISADSGVPTFRGEGGLWKEHRPEELATPEAFARDPRLVWEWYAWRRELVGRCQPNEAHLALARWALRREGVHLVTQNVDGLHVTAAEKAAEQVAEATGREPPSTRHPGASRELAAAGDAQPDRPLELHGSLFRTRCTACDRRRPHREAIQADAVETLPRCGACGALLRPDVVWFGEPLPEAVIGRAASIARLADVCLVVGTSAVVQPAAGLATAVARRGGALIEVNPAATPLTRVADVSLRAGAAESVPGLLETGEP